MADRIHWLSARAAAARLSITRATLYAYVSRGHIRRRVSPDGIRHYASDDIERLRLRSAARRGHGPVAAGALHWGEAVLNSAITAILPQGPAYRGHPLASLLAQGAQFEQVAELLWTGQLPARESLVDGWPIAGVPYTPAPQPANSPVFGQSLFAIQNLLVQRIGTESAGSPANAHVTARRPPTARKPAANHTANDGDDTAETGSHATLAYARQLLVDITAHLADPRRSPRRTSPSAASHRLRPQAPQARFTLAAQLATHWRRPAAQRAIEVAMICCADHELPASTFAARIAAAADADLPACLLAALATFCGPAHGTHSRQIWALLDSSPDTPARLVAARMRANQALPGCGHQMYANGDPRFAPLWELACTVARKPAPFARVEAYMHAISRYTLPNVDLGLVALATAYGLPRDAPETMFAVGRTAGWIAHILEQRSQPGLLRPRARYTGMLPEFG